MDRIGSNGWVCCHRDLLVLTGEPFSGRGGKEHAFRSAHTPCVVVFYCRVCLPADRSRRLTQCFALPRLTLLMDPKRCRLSILESIDGFWVWFGFAWPGLAIFVFVFVFVPRCDAGFLPRVILKRVASENSTDCRETSKDGIQYSTWSCATNELTNSRTHELSTKDASSGTNALHCLHLFSTIPLRVR